jgi:hypothetical protein
VAKLFVGELVDGGLDDESIAHADNAGDPRHGGRGRQVA